MTLFLMICTNMIAESVSSSLQQSSSHSTMYSANQTSILRDIELSNGQIIQSAIKDIRIKSNEISQENDKTKDLVNNEEIDTDSKESEHNKTDEACERELHVNSELTSEQSEVTEANDGKTSSNECEMEDCSPQKRREKRMKRRKRKSLVEILFV